MLRRAILLAPALLVAGCSTPDASPQRPAPPADRSAPKITAPAAAFVGHILSVDLRTATAVIDISTFATLPPFLEGQILLSRREEDRRITAQLRATGLLRGRTLGAILLAGRPQVGDEIVIQPELTAAAPAPTQPR